MTGNGHAGERARWLGYAALAGFVGCVWFSNWLLTTFGFWHLPGTPWDVPAGVFAVGLSFGLRDAVQERLGPWWVLPGIAAGAALSYLLSDPVVTPEGFVVATAQRVAVASGIAFTISELVDFAVYTPLRNRSWKGAVVVSNVVAAVVDSLLFLWLCFESLEFFWGQVIGKIAMTGLAFPIVLWARGRRQWVPKCDVYVCENPARIVDIGESGDLYLCLEHGGRPCADPACPEAAVTHRHGEVAW